MSASMAIQVLVDFALKHVREADEEEQVKVYQALAETLPNPASRSAARELAVSMSRVAALQLELGLSTRGQE
jgi:hypothetical protein